MRCPQCQQENPPGARFCLQCGRSLLADCAACGQPLPEGAKFCMQCGAAVGRSSSAATAVRSPESYTPPHLAEKILASRSAIEGERKPVTVLFCDMVSSTALAEQLGPEGLHSLFSRFFETALAEIHRYEGTINQFLGDGFMALFGAPLAHEDHARRAVLAALDIRRALNDRPLQLSGRLVPVSLRLGLHTGFVVVGAIGNNLRMDYTAVGDTTHLAARLQQMAEPGAIVISEATARLVRGYVALDTRGEVEVRGRSAPVTIHLVTGRGQRRSPLEDPAERKLSHFVGRGRELGALKELLAEVEAARGQVVGIVGEPGVGKSRLLLEFQSTLAGRRVTYLEGRCLSFGSAIPFLPVLDIVRNACGLTEADPPETMIEKVQVTLADVGMDATAGLPFLLHLLGVKEPSEHATESLAGLSPESIKARTFEILRQMSLRASRRRPVILVVEDLHWIDRTSEEYLASLVESLPGMPVMLLTTYRPGYRPAWMDKSYTTQLSLARLTPTDSLTIVRSVMPEAGLGDPLSKMILDKAEGNPFFLEELARAVGDQGLSRPGLSVPDTVHVVLAARIDRLAEQPKRLLQTASVLGREFSVRVLEAIWDGGPLEQHLHVLTRQEFLHERSGAEDATYVFKHALTQDVAEATILAPRRRELHLRAAQMLEALYPDRPRELAPRLAHHYFQAEAWPLACEHATRAAEAARAVYANREALQRYDEALTAGERAGLPVAERMRLHAARGRVHGALGAFETARADLEAALAMARDAGDARASVDLLGELGELWGGHRDYQRGLALTLEAVQTAETAGDRRLLAEALVRTGLMHLNLARISESERGLQRAFAIFEELGDEHGGARTLDVLSTTFCIGGRVERGIAHGRDALRRYRAIGNRTAQTSVVTNIGLWLAISGQRRESEALTRQGLQAAIDLGALNDEAYAHAGLGWLFEIYGEYGPGLRESSTALELARQIGHREWSALGLSILGRITRTCGDIGRARALHEEVLAIARELGTVLWIANARSELGEDLIAAGDEDGGIRLLEEAVVTAGEAVEFVVPPLLAHADFLLRQRRLEDALHTARRAHEAAREFAPWALEADRIEGEALGGLGNTDGGDQLLRDTKAKAHALGVAPVAWRASLGLADRLTARRRHEEASAERTEARSMLERAAAELPEDLRQAFAATRDMRRARD